MFGKIYLHQTSTECVSNQYTHFDMSNLTDVSYGTTVILLCFVLEFSYIIDQHL